MEVFEHPGDPLYWFWLRVSCILFYILVAARQLCRPGWSRYIRDLAAATKQDLFPKRVMSRDFSLTSVLPENGVTDCRAKDFQADIAYDVLTQGIGPYCCATLVLSLLRNFSEESPLHNPIRFGLLYGDANILTLAIVSIIWMLQVRPNMKWRMVIWAILAFWYSYISFRSMLDPQLVFSEDVMLNHMVFLAITSLTLGLPRPYAWLLTLGHSIFFLSYTLSLQDSPRLKYKPSVGLQVFCVAIMAVFTKYSQVLKQVNNSQAKVEFALREAELIAHTREEEARLAREDATLAAERATIAEAEARAARAENEAHEARVKADRVEQDKDAIEEHAKLMECTRGAFQHLLNLLCDAVVELDGNLKLTAPGKLGVLLSQGAGTDLHGRPFKDFVQEHDRERLEHWVTSDEHEFPLQVTLLGSYNSKIKVVVYAAGFRDHGQTVYFVGITEAEEQEKDFLRACSKQSSSSQILASASEEFPCHSISEAYEEIVQDLRSPLSPTSQTSTVGWPEPGGPTRCSPPKNGSKGSSQRSRVTNIEAMQPEDQMQSLLALLWSWPTTEEPACGSRCCHTHEMLEVAMDRLRSLKSLNCSATPSCLVWQCPSCKLMGTPEESQYFDEVQLHCGRCRSWDMLF